MILTRDVDLHRPFAAPDAVARAIADELRKHGCRIRQVTPGMVEFNGPSPFRFTFSYSERAAAGVSSGVLWLDPADGRVRTALRISSLQLLVAIVPACIAVTTDVSVLGRLLALMGTPVLLWVNLIWARSVFVRWITVGANRA